MTQASDLPPMLMDTLSVLPVKKRMLTVREGADPLVQTATLITCRQHPLFSGSTIDVDVLRANHQELGAGALCHFLLFSATSVASDDRNISFFAFFLS